jgi:hypothetical protein
MKVIIPTKDRSETIQTHKVFADFDLSILVHDKAQAALYRANPTVPADRLVVTGVTGDAFGLTRQREWACVHLLQPGEWCVFADDNIAQLTAVDEAHWRYGNLPTDRDEEGNKWRAVYGGECPGERFLRIAEECVAMAERVHAHLVGFATTSNPFFRGKQWRQVGYVIGKLMVWQNVGVPFDHTVTMEDFYHTAEHLRRFGTVLINNFVFPVATHYNEGGMGTKNERLPHRRRDVAVLAQRYAGLLRPKPREDGNPDLCVALTTLAQVKKWQSRSVV